jgi:hypothetical protein
MEFPSERDPANKPTTGHAGSASTASDRKRDIDLLMHSRRRLAASRELLRKPVRTLIAVREPL